MWVEKTKNGKVKFCEEFTDDTGKRRKVSVTYSKNTASTRKQAQKELLQKIEEKKESSDLTLSNLMDVFLTDKKQEVRQNTYRNIYYSLNRLDEYISLKTKLEDLNGAMINSRLKDASRGMQVAVKQMLRYAFLYDYIKEDLSQKIRLNPSEKKFEKLYFEKDELAEVFETLEAQNSYNYKILRLLIEFLTLTGLRIGEALALEYADVEDNILNVNKAVTEKRIHPPKTSAGYRTIAINSRAKQIIAETKMLKRIFRIDSDIIFSSRYNVGYLNANSLYTYLARVGLPQRFHIYRHTHASLLAEQGVSLEAIQRRLGHESEEITKQIYIHITEKKKKSEDNFFSNLEIL